MPIKTFIVYGNHGEVVADAYNGQTITVKPCPDAKCTCKGVGYQNITAFDVTDWQQRNQQPLPERVDIIHIGSWEIIKDKSFYQPAR